MAAGRLHVATPTTVVTIDVAVVMTVAVTTGDVMSNSQRTAVTSVTYLLHR
jgi:hypothetical protein